MSSFSRAVAGVTALLLVLAVGAGATAMSRGPQQRGLSYDSQALTQLAGQRIILRSNQVLAPESANAITIEPHAEFIARTEDTALVIEFTHPLRYQHEYHLVAGNVRGVATAASSEWTANLTTADGGLLYAAPTETGVDILRTATHDVRTETVIRSLLNDPVADVTALLDLGASAAVVSTTPTGASALTIGPLDGSPPNTVALPVAGRISGLSYDPFGSRLEFDVTPGGSGGGGGDGDGDGAGVDVGGGADGAGVLSDSDTASGERDSAESSGTERWFVSTTNTLAAERVLIPDPAGDSGSGDYAGLLPDAWAETMPGSGLHIVDGQVYNSVGDTVYSAADAALRATAVCPSANLEFAAVRLEPVEIGSAAALGGSASYAVIAADGTSIRSITATAVSWCGDLDSQQGDLPGPAG